MLKKVYLLFLATIIIAVSSGVAFSQPGGGGGGCGGCGGSDDFDVWLSHSDNKIAFPVQNYDVKKENDNFRVSGNITNEDDSKTDFSNKEVNIALVNNEGISEIFQVMQVGDFKYEDVVGFEFVTSRDVSKFPAIVNNIFAKDNEHVNISKALDFIDYKKTASVKELVAIEKQFKQSKLSNFFIEGIRKIEDIFVVLVIGETSCPDCSMVYPYIEAINANPHIETKYFSRETTPCASGFITSHLGRSNIPAIFVMYPNGYLLPGNYSETPKKVTALLENAKNKEEYDAIWQDFYTGVYGEDIQKDILEMLEKAMKGYARPETWTD